MEVETFDAEEDKPKGFDDFELRLGDLMRGERATLGKSLLDVQRELKIKATYIAAIENADLSAFETPGFIAGYVRSYARYLGMDPEWAFETFCAEAGFRRVAWHVGGGLGPAAADKARAGPKVLRDPFADPNATFIPRGEALLSRVEPGAVGSIAVLVALIGAIGYGGWSVLQEVQRVQLAPVEQAPTVVAEIDPLGNVSGEAPLVRSAPTDETQTADAGADPVAEAGGQVLDRLYRPQALDVPVLTSRDGPIAAIDPRRRSRRCWPRTERRLRRTMPVADGVEADCAGRRGRRGRRSKFWPCARPGCGCSAADGTVLFEKILDAGERYAVPQLEEPAVFRAGNSGSIYFVVNGADLWPGRAGGAGGEERGAVARGADARAMRWPI